MKKMLKIKTIAAALGIFLLATLPSCIYNDIPYARIQANFLTLQATGQDAATVIDSTARTVTISFPEEVDLEKVRIASYTLTPGATILDNPLLQPLNLLTPITVTLRLYQDYNWRIVAKQNIERYFEVEGQMGDAVIDPPGRRVVLSVRQGTDLAAIKIVRAKLGPTGSEYDPSLEPGTTFNATHPAQIEVCQYGTWQTWTIFVDVVDVPVKTVRVDPWTCVAWVYGQAEAGLDNGVEYRLAADTQWLRLPQANVTQSGGSFTGRIDHLSPNTAYIARTYSGPNIGDEIPFTTGSIVQPPNMDFDYWWLDGKIWCPWAEGTDPYWGTGNKGATTLGTSNTFPTDDTPTGSGRAAQLETRFVGLGIIGKLAAGNIFVGSYVRTDGTNGVLSFGRPFTERPTKLKGWYKYTTAPIDRYASELAYMAGQPDTCTVWIALIDTPEPLEIRTDPKNRSLFDPDADYVVAYGRLQKGETVSAWTPFEFNLEYRATNRVPKYLLMACSASKYGDYFTGGAGAVMVVDDFELLYDY